MYGQVDVDAEDVGVSGDGDPQAAHRLVGDAADPPVSLAELVGELLATPFTCGSTSSRPERTC